MHVEFMIFCKAHSVITISQDMLLTVSSLAIDPIVKTLGKASAQL